MSQTPLIREFRSRLQPVLRILAFAVLAVPVWPAVQAASFPPEQIRTVVEEHAESFEDPQQMVRWYYSDAQRLQEVEGMVLEDNVVEWAAKSMDVTTVTKTFDEIMEIKR